MKDDAPIHPLNQTLITRLYAPNQSGSPSPMSEQKDVALAQAELTTARLCVNDWHPCNDHDELARWRQAQLRLIAAAQAYERVTLQERIGSLTARCEALEQSASLQEMDAAIRIQQLEMRCEALTAERDRLIASQQADQDRFDRDLAHYSQGYTEAVTDVTGALKP